MPVDTSDLSKMYKTFQRWSDSRRVAFADLTYDATSAQQQAGAQRGPQVGFAHLSFEHAFRSSLYNNKCRSQGQILHFLTENCENNVKMD